MAQAVEDLLALGAPAFETATPMLSQLLKAEIAERELRSIAYHTKVARFPSYRDLAGFDFTASGVNEATVRQRHRGVFMEGAENVVLIGDSGTGKSHNATPIGVQAVEHHRCKVRFSSTVDPVNALKQDKALGKSGSLLRENQQLEVKCAASPRRLRRDRSAVPLQGKQVQRPIKSLYSGLREIQSVSSTAQALDMTLDRKTERPETPSPSDPQARPALPAHVAGSGGLEPGWQRAPATMPPPLRPRTRAGPMAPIGRSSPVGAA